MTNPSFTGVTSGEKATEVILSTDDPYLIEAEYSDLSDGPKGAPVSSEAGKKRGFRR